MRNPFKFPRPTVEESYEFKFDWEEPGRGYLKKMALETVVGFIARSVALTTFRHTIGEKRQYGDIDYRLNVRPNQDQSAAEFWYHFAYKLIHDREALIVFDDERNMLIADTFEQLEYAVFPNLFQGVVVNDYEFKRTFNMEEVIYIRLGNRRLEQFMSGMFTDYTDLFNRMIAVQLRSNQLRAIVGIDASQSLDANKQAKLQKFIDDLFKSFREKTIAIIPKLKGFEYEEVSDGTSSGGRSVNELWELKKALINEVADILGVPQALVHGDIADMDSLMKAYTKFCIDPINKLIEDELNVKIIGRDDYMKGERIHVVGVRAKDVIDNSEAVDKLIASGAFTPNQVRVLFGYEPSKDPELDKHFITKNYQTAIQASGGGETT